MYAYAASEAQTVAQGFLSKINEAILFPLITLMMALALLIFLYGAFEYVRGANSEGDRETGKRHLLYGTIGMLVMLSAMAILYVAAGTFGLDDEIDDIRDAGSQFDRGIFFFGDDDSYNDRGPSEDFFQDDPENAEFDDEYTDDEGETVAENNLFKDADSLLFDFHKESIDAAYGASLSFDQVKGLYGAVPNGEYPADYVSYEQTYLLPMCEDIGGSEVFSISVNRDTSRQFYCVQ